MKEYTQNNLTITWEPEKCTHSGICARGLRTVFQPKEKPWIKTGVEDDATVMKQIDACPSKALGYYLKENKNER